MHTWIMEASLLMTASPSVRDREDMRGSENAITKHYKARKKKFRV